MRQPIAKRASQTRPPVQRAHNPAHPGDVLPTTDGLAALHRADDPNRYQLSTPVEDHGHQVPQRARDA